MNTACNPTADRYEEESSVTREVAISVYRERSSRWTNPLAGARRWIAKAAKRRRQRNTLRQLQALDDRLLRDIGLSRDGLHEAVFGGGERDA